MNILLDPNLVYLLLLAGTLLGLLALITPGTGGLEIGALVFLLAAGFAIAPLKFNLWALIPLLLSVVPFVYAIRKPKREVFLAIAILGMVIGSAYLFVGDKWWIPGVNPVLAVVASVLYTIFLWIVVRKSLQAYHKKPLHDLEELIGKVGEARTPIHGEGSVQIESELWSARSEEPILKGGRVRVVGREGFILLVDKES